MSRRSRLSTVSSAEEMEAFFGVGEDRSGAATAQGAPPVLVTLSVFESLKRNLTDINSFNITWGSLNTTTKSLVSNEKDPETNETLFAIALRTRGIDSRIAPMLGYYLPEAERKEIIARNSASSLTFERVEVPPIAASKPSELSKIIKITGAGEGTPGTAAGDPELRPASPPLTNVRK